MDILEDLSIKFAAWADDFESVAPMYADVARGAAATPELLELLACAPEEQQLPVLLFASVHSLVLSEPDLALGAFYPSVNGGESLVNGAFDAFAELCLARREEIVHLVTTKVTQTNEVGRCRLYLPALCQIEPDIGPLSLVDVGASAGLNLYLDRFHYSYTPATHSTATEVGPPSTVELACELRGDLEPSISSIPTVAGRLGVDQFPIDLTDANDRNWLRACVWPEQTERFHRLDAAIEIAVSMPTEVRRGDATTELADSIRTAREFGHPVVMNSWVLNYLSANHRRAYVAELDGLGRRGDLTWVFAESPAFCTHLPFPADPRWPNLTSLMLVAWRDGERSVRHLADCHPHGEWLHWVDEAVV